ncbi:hypothetical protein HMPREF1979_00991 [Actinomyces johnsonii F0542]|uniref:Uncharacterized protein n=1 Tax=Actinomyces johnsonii F0542 TaxID=1321818 RepID=U1QSE5_9ACTO|nr:DUF2142 domain-containing protein [Actinomyces johnsonii]ERH24876.1 hypothetical protein HMPREF1979_00991 [Actinomyces johnsonii F0542]
MKHLDAAAVSETSAAIDTSYATGNVESETFDEEAAQSDADGGGSAETEPEAESSAEQECVSSGAVAEMADLRCATEGKVAHGRLTRWLVTAERLTPGQVFWLAFGALFVLMSAWAFYVPAMAAADEPAHMWKAVATVRGQVVNPEILGTREVVIPEMYRDAQDFMCNAFHPDTPESICDVSKVFTQETPEGVRQVVSPAALYNPLYYGIIGWPSLLPDNLVNIYLMRLISVAISALFFAAGFRALRQADMPALSMVAATAVVTPSAVFLCSVINPQALEISAAFALWCQLLLVIRKPAPELLGRRMWLLAFITVMFANSRGLSPFFLALIVISCVSLQPWRFTWRVIKDRRSWLPILVAFLGTVAASAWVLVTNGLEGGGGPDAAPELLFRRVFKGTLYSTDTYIQQIVGTFGWMDTVMPMWWVIMFSVAFVASMLLVWTVGSWRERTVALGAGLVFCVLVPAVLHGREARVIGWMWQGRYIFPVLIGLPVLVAFVLQARLSHRRIPMGRRLLLSWALLFVVTHVAGLIITMHRYINGIYGSWRYITKDSWLPPVPLWGAGVAMVLFVIGMVVLLVRMVPAEDLGQDGLTVDGDTPNIGVEIDNRGECKGSLNASLPESETELRTA